MWNCSLRVLVESLSGQGRDDRSFQQWVGETRRTLIVLLIPVKPLCVKGGRGEIDMLKEEEMKWRWKWWGRIFWLTFFEWRITVALFKSNRKGSDSIIGVKQERLLEGRRTEFTVPIEATESKILFFVLVFRVVAETYLLNWHFESINTMEMWTVAPVCPRTLRVCLEVVRKMNWSSRIQINANYHSFYAYIYCWNARQRAVKIFQQYD